MRHWCWWKFNRRNSLSVPTLNLGGVTAVRLGVPSFRKEDRATGRYFCSPSRVYKETQSIWAVNWSGGHSTRRPSLLRIGSQWSVITSGSSDSDDAAREMKRLKLSMSFLEGMVSASNPRRLHLMSWTHWWSNIKISYLLGRMSSSDTPRGRFASRGGGLSSFSSVAHFLGGDERGLLSSKGHFCFQLGSAFGVETRSGTSMEKSISSSSDMMMVAASSRVITGRVWSGSTPPSSYSLLTSASTSAVYT